VVVVGVEKESVTLDANHPLAGKALTFDIEVLDIN
jgi:FKBP-type peptidyl-prolyl cis-trans isomerase 2